MLVVALVILLATGAGAMAERRWAAGAQQAARRGLSALAYVLVPLVTFFTVSHVRLTSGVAAGLAFAWIELLVVTALAWAFGTFVLRLSRPATGALMCSVALANTGLLGLPMVATLIGGSTALGQAITYDVAVSAPMLFLTAFAIGAAFGTRAGESAGTRLRAFLLRNPPLVAFVLALVAPGWATPDTARDVAEVVVLLVAPIGFFALGVTLMQEQEEGVRVFPPPLTPAVATALGLRLIVAPGLMLLMSATIVTVPRTFLVQAAMACGIHALTVSHLYGLDLRLAAGAVSWSTAIVLTAGVAIALTGGL